MSGAGTIATQAPPSIAFEHIVTHLNTFEHIEHCWVRVMMRALKCRVGSLGKVFKTRVADLV